jgi:hypothetical protein
VISPRKFSWTTIRAYTANGSLFRLAKSAVHLSRPGTMALVAGDDGHSHRSFGTFFNFFAERWTYSLTNKYMFRRVLPWHSSSLCALFSDH